MLKRLWRWLGRIRNFILFMLALAIIFASLWFVPKWQVQSKTTLNEKERIEMENDTRRTWAQIFAGAVVLFGAYEGWKRLEISQEGQITERFTRAIEQLGATDDKGNPKIEIRLGGIYALERIAKDSKADHWTVMEVLTAYIRRNFPAPKSSDELKDRIQKVSSTIFPKVPIDIDAICMVLIGRRLEHEQNNDQALDLSGTDLFGVKLLTVNLENAFLDGVCLIGSQLERAHLTKVFLREAHLEKAILWKTNLEEANLQNANLDGAILEAALLMNANFMRTSLRGVDFSMADLRGAKNLTIGQLFKVKTLYKAKLDKELLNQVKEYCPHLLENPFPETK